MAIYNDKKKAYFEADDKNKEGSYFSSLLKADGELMSFEQYSLQVLRKMIQIKAEFHTTGLYGQHLQTWTKLFKRNQILVLSYDEVRSNYKKLQWRIEQFLQVRMNNVGGIGLPDDDPRRGEPAVPRRGHRPRLQVADPARLTVTDRKPSAPARAVRSPSNPPPRG